MITYTYQLRGCVEPEVRHDDSFKWDDDVMTVMMTWGEKMTLQTRTTQVAPSHDSQFGELPAGNAEVLLAPTAQLMDFGPVSYRTATNACV